MKSNEKAKRAVLKDILNSDGTVNREIVVVVNDRNASTRITFSGDNKRELLRLVEAMAASKGDEKVSIETYPTVRKISRAEKTFGRRQSLRKPASGLAFRSSVHYLKMLEEKESKNTCYTLQMLLADAKT